MGNDGGSIPTRRELVKEGAKNLTTTQVKEIQTEQQEHFWATCALSHEPLVPPVVSDGLGTLYNKAAVLDHLLALTQEDADMDTLRKRGEAFKDRIRSLKDVVEVRFESDKAESSAFRFFCPITNKTLGPGTRAIYLVPCGHAFVDSVVKEMVGERCLQCNNIYSQDNIISILPTSQSEKDRLEQRLQDLKSSGLSHALKKTGGSHKKRKKVAPSEVEVKVDFSKDDLGLKQGLNSIRNPDTASLTTKVLAEQEDRNKKRKINTNENVKALFSSKKGIEGNNSDFMNRGFSIPATAKRKA